MPRQRPRRRRRRAAGADRGGPPQPQISEPLETASNQRRLPTAGIVTAAGLGIWLGWAFTTAGGIVESVVLWIGVLMAGLGGGRLLRRRIQSRRDRSR